MTTFSRNWNASYEGLPPNNEGARKGASRVRELKTDIRERMAVDHSWTGTADDGKHAQITLLPASADPATIPAGRLYAKMSGTTVEMYYKNSAGLVTQLTFGSVTPNSQLILPGTIIAVGNQVAANGPDYIQCDGRAVNRITYAGLFFAIGILWGIGDGVNTFNVPDLRGRTLIGQGTGIGLTPRISGQTLGEETHKLTTAEMPAHDHQFAVSSAAMVIGTPVASAQGTQTVMGAGLTAFKGGDVAHENMQPSAAINYWIKT